jgi:hypothetical protein
MFGGFFAFKHDGAGGVQRMVCRFGNDGWKKMQIPRCARDDKRTDRDDKRQRGMTKDERDVRPTQAGMQIPRVLGMTKDGRDDKRRTGMSVPRPQGLKPGAIAA